jgi:hypothetical protein
VVVGDPEFLDVTPESELVEGVELDDQRMRVREI